MRAAAIDAVVDDWTWGEPMLEARPPEGDSWDFDPDADLPDVRYHGVRRAGARPRLNLVVVLAAVGGLLLLGTAITFIMWTGSDDDRSTQADGAIPGPLTSDDASSPGVSPSASASAPVAVASAAASPPVVAKPITIEAEDGPPAVKRRGTEVVSLAGASGGKAVRLLDQDSQIDLRGVSVPVAGTYRITVYYVSAKASSAQVTVAGKPPSTVTFTAGSECCQTATVDIALGAGRYDITLAANAGGPTIDRIVIAPTPA